MKRALLMFGVPALLVLCGCGSSSGGAQLGPATSPSPATSDVQPTTEASAPLVETTTSPSSAASSTTPPDGPLDDATVAAAVAHIDAIAATVAASGDTYSIDRCPMGSFTDYHGFPKVLPDLSEHEKYGVKRKDNGHGVLRCYFDGSASSTTTVFFQVVVATASQEEVAGVDASYSSSYTRTPGDERLGGIFYTTCDAQDDRCASNWIRDNLVVEFEFDLYDLGYPHVTPDVQAYLAGNVEEIVSKLAALDPVSVVVYGPLES